MWKVPAHPKHEGREKKKEKKNHTHTHNLMHEAILRRFSTPPIMNMN
jgi:hypothetical protein